jgi:hypothetical protein
MGEQPPPSADGTPFVREGGKAEHSNAQVPVSPSALPAVESMPKPDLPPMKPAQNSILKSIKNTLTKPMKLPVAVIVIARVIVAIAAITAIILNIGPVVGSVVGSVVDSLLRSNVRITALNENANANIGRGGDATARISAAEAFELTVSVEETTLPQGRDFRVIAELKNISEDDHAIQYRFLFWPHVEGWDPFGGITTRHFRAESTLFEANSTIRNVDIRSPGFSSDDGRGWLVGAGLEPGTHELRFSATFVLPDYDSTTPIPGYDHSPVIIPTTIEIVSDPILLTVTEGDTRADDFELTISVKEATLPQGEDFWLQTELKNISGNGHEVVYLYLFHPRIPEWVPFRAGRNYRRYVSDFFEANSIVRINEVQRGLWENPWGDDERGWRFGSNLEPGTHELRVEAIFRLQDEPEYQINIMSDPILLTVTEGDTRVDDFELTFSVEEAISPQGQGFVVNAELRNIGEDDHEVWHTGFFNAYVPGRDRRHPSGVPGADPPELILSTLLLFEAGDVVQHSLLAGTALEPGTHELQVTAEFSFPDRGRNIMIRSNTITVTVTEGPFGLIISAGETAVSQGENVIVDVELRNNSEEDYEIEYSLLFWPLIRYWNYIPWRVGGPDGLLNHSSERIFMAGSTIRNITLIYEPDEFGVRRDLEFCEDETVPWVIDTSRLEPGIHELQFSAGFSYWDIESGEWQRIVVLSNPITLTVR